MILSSIFAVSNLGIFKYLTTLLSSTFFRTEFKLLYPKFPFPKLSNVSGLVLSDTIHFNLVLS